MQISWRIINILMLGLLGLLGLLGVVTASVEAADYSLIYKLPFDSRMILQGDRGKASATRLKGNIKTFLVVGKTLHQIMVEADELIAIDPNYFPLGNGLGFTAIARLPSSASGPESFCGVGHEDYIVLISLMNGRLELSDRILIQSCNSSLTLISDQGDDPGDAVTSLNPPWIARLEISSPFINGVVQQCIRVDQSKLVVDENCPDIAPQ